MGLLTPFYVGVCPIEFNGAYSRERVYKIVSLVTSLKLKIIYQPSVFVVLLPLFKSYNLHHAERPMLYLALYTVLYAKLLKVQFEVLSTQEQLYIIA